MGGTTDNRLGVQASPRGVAPCCIIVRVQLVHHDWQDVGVQGSSPAGMKVIESVMPMLMPMPTRPVSPTLAGPRAERLNWARLMALSYPSISRSQRHTRDPRPAGEWTQENGPGE